MSGIGHNRGPDLRGTGWRRHAWTRARRDLLPHMPLNVVRRRVARARALGLAYPVYATIRATTGRDIVGFLFSHNALDLGQAERLARIEGAVRIGLVRARLDGWPLDAQHPQPGPWDAHGCIRDRLGAARGPLPADGVVIVGAAPWERGWCATGHLAGYIDAERYFAA